jgi:hypothetical protein
MKQHEVELKTKREKTVGGGVLPSLCAVMLEISSIRRASLYFLLTPMNSPHSCCVTLNSNIPASIDNDVDAILVIIRRIMRTELDRLSSLCIQQKIRMARR